MSSSDKLKAHENSVKIENALRQVKNRDANEKQEDLTIFVDERGERFVTTERAVKSVEPLTFTLPTNEQVFDENLIPDYKFLMNHFKREGRLSEYQLTTILEAATEIFENEPNLLSVPCPTTVVGDIHGQYYDLCKMFDMCGDPSDTQYLFLGDYVDRGDYSIEVLILLYAMKINFPKTFWLMRGNHESKRMTDYFTFKRECQVKYSIKIYRSSLDSFKALPLCAILNEQFLCCHGGISKEWTHISDINKINRFRYDFPSRGLYCDIMWADPSPDFDTETFEDDGEETYFRENYERHCSYYFTHKAACRFLEDNNLLSIIRAHQAQDAGYRMYKKSESTGFPSVITLFSAPNYCGTYRNKAAALVYDGSTFNIKQFVSTTTPYHLPDFMDVFEWSIPFVSEKVVDILLSVLNICTEDELVKKTPLARDVANSLQEVPEAVIATQLDLKESEKESSGEVRASLRKKLLSIGRMSRMFTILREESEKVEHLRAFAGGMLPKGVLMDGREELHNRLKSFSEARKADLDNEGLPPSEEEMEKLEEVKNAKLRKYIDDGEMDVDDEDDGDEGYL